MAISPQRLTIYLYSAHRAVIFAIAQLSCFTCAMIFVSAIFAVESYFSIIIQYFIKTA